MNWSSTTALRTQQRRCRRTPAASSSHTGRKSSARLFVRMRPSMSHLKQARFRARSNQLQSRAQFQAQIKSRSSAEAELKRQHQCITSCFRNSAAASDNDMRQRHRAVVANGRFTCRIRTTESNLRPRVRADFHADGATVHLRKHVNNSTSSARCRWWNRAQKTQKTTHICILRASSCS